MKAILEYDLTQQDDSDSFDKAVNATRMYYILWELQHNFIRKLPDEIQEQVREKLMEEFDGFDVDNL
jgi:hypothetical protein